MAKKTKLELTWIGKEERPRLEPRILLEDPELSYHASRHVTERDEFDNRVIYGDNLLALKALEAEFTGKVKCIYIDPPFNTQQTFEHYDDGLEHSLWLSMMRDRLNLLHRLLHESGSMFIHIDDNELGYLIAVADEIFGRNNRISVITFKQSSASGPKAVNPGLVTTSNFILYYAKNKSVWDSYKVFIPTKRDTRYGSYITNYSEPYFDWRLDTLRNAFALKVGIPPKQLKEHFGESLDQEIESFVLESPERVVRLARVTPKDINAEARAELEKSIKNPGIVQRAVRKDKDDYYFLGGQQLLFYSSKVRKLDGRYVTGEAASTIWDDLLSNNVHNEGGVYFPNGKKPEALIKRILELSTRQGDLVLDSFAGSGTTGAVAQKMGRRWIMVELHEHCYTHIAPRLRRVIDGTDVSGITQAVNWRGGGGFRFFRLAPSLLVQDKYGNYVINRDYNAEMLAEAMCKHESFTYAPSETVYWQHGRSSETDFIYVTTQSLTRDQLVALSEDVGPDRTLLVCAFAFRARDGEFSNLTFKKIPNTVLHRCEWGRDDYSLQISQLPPPDEPAAAESDAVAEPAPANGKSRRKRRGEPAAAATLFADAEGGGDGKNVSEA